MSIKTFDSALDFTPANAKASRPGFISNVLTTLAAVGEGITLAGEYKSLTNRGMAPDVAARKVFEKIGK